MADETLKIDSNMKSVAGAVTDDSNQYIKMLRIDDATKGLKVSLVGGVGVGTVTSVSVTTANGVSGSVATATTTPAITLTLGAITPTTVNGNTLTTGTGTITITGTKTLTVSNTASISGTNTGDQTNISGNAATVTTNANLTGIVTSTGNATAIADKAISYTKLADGTDGNLITWDANGVAALVATGTATQVLTSNGAGAAPTFQAVPASGSTPAMTMVTDYTASTRYDFSNSNGTQAYGVGGLLISSSATQNSYARVAWNIGGTGEMEDDSPTMSFSISMAAIGTDMQFFVGLGNVGTDGTTFTWTNQHAGFKIIRAASGNINLYATQGQGTTETASASLTTLADNDNLDLIIKINSTTSIDYYWRKNGSALSTATNLTTNLPTTSAGAIYANINNVNVATQNQIYVRTANYSR